MKNNDDKGLYEIGEKQPLSCGCIIVAEKVGYTHYVNPECHHDNKFHPGIKGYSYRPMYELQR
jgi:hypothetical protein